MRAYVRYELIETWHDRDQNIIDVCSSLKQCLALARADYRHKLEVLPNWQIPPIGYICRHIKTGRRTILLGRGWLPKRGQ